MYYPQFIIKGIDKEGAEVRASSQWYRSRHLAELASLDFYGDHRFKLVWVERTAFASSSA